MHNTEIVHAILQISHVSEKVFGHLARRLDGARWCYGRSVHGVRCMARRRRRMSRKISRHHDRHQSSGRWEDREKVGIKANEGANGEQGECMGGCPPSKEALQTVLEDEYYPNPV